MLQCIITFVEECSSSRFQSAMSSTLIFHLFGQEVISAESLLLLVPLLSQDQDVLWSQQWQCSGQSLFLFLVECYHVMHHHSSPYHCHPVPQAQLTIHIIWNDSLSSYRCLETDSVVL